MDKLTSGEPRWELLFDEDGTVEGLDRQLFFRQLKDSGVEDLIVFSHGWNNDADKARGLYDDMFPLIASACEGVETLGRVGFIGVLWPSVWFPETPAVVTLPAGSGQSEVVTSFGESSGSDMLTGREIAASVGAGFARHSDRESVREIGRLMDRGIASTEGGLADAFTEGQQKELIREIHRLAQSLMPLEGQVSDEDSGETALFFERSPEQVYQGVATTFGTTPPEDDSESVGDWFHKALEGSKDMVRILSYIVMKHRAGKIGSVGLGPLISDFRTEAADVRVHLVGHSFGARLVSFALSTVGEAVTSPVHSLLLIQGAFSYLAFSHAKDNPFGKAGALHDYASRVRGPLVATFSKYDYAVCRWYPRASFLSGEDTQTAEGMQRWGGMGAHGFQAVRECRDISLRKDGAANLKLQVGTFYRVDAQLVICDYEQSRFSGAHSDIRKPPLAQLVAATAGGHA